MASQPLPPAPEDINAISREAWDALRDKVNRSDNLQATPPLNLTQGAGGAMLSITKVPTHRPGIIVCPPAGRPALEPPMAWVSLARISNKEDDPETALVTFEPWPPGSDFAMTVAAVDLGAYHCKDPEQFKPGTPVVLEWGLDLGNPPRRRFYFRTAERAECLPPCHPPPPSRSPCCNCYEVSTTEDPEGPPPVQLHQTGPAVWAAADGTSITQVSTADGLKWELTFPDGTKYTADGTLPCPPATVGGWSHVDFSGPTTLVSIACCTSSSSSSGGCCDCYQAQVTEDPTQPPIQLNAAGADSWTSDDDQSYLQRDNDTGAWTLTLQTADVDQTVFTADASSPCPPTDAAAWTRTSGPAPLVDFRCCESSSSSSSSSGSSSSSDSSSSSSGSSSSDSSSGPSGSSGACPPITNVRWNDDTKSLESSTDCGATWSTIVTFGPCGT